MIQGKKILVVTTTDNMIWQFLLPHIEDLKANNNTVECACNETGFWFKEMEKSGLKLHKIDFPRNPLSTKLFKAKKQLCNLVKNNHYDLIICHQPVGGVMGRIAGHKYHIPVIYVAHGFHFFKGCPKKNLIYKAVEKYYSRYTDALVTMNEEDYQAALKFKAKRVYKINGIGVDLSIYHLDENLDCHKHREELGVSEGDFVVISVAEFIKRKNVITLIKAIERINEKSIKLVLCGCGKLEQELRNYVNEKNLNSRVKFAGYRKDISKCIQVCDCLVLASYHEGLPRCIMEAMALGKPVICSDVRGSRDLIKGAGGIIVGIKDIEGYKNAVLTLSQDSAMRETFSNRNMEAIKQYSLENVLQQMRKIYEEM